MLSNSHYVVWMKAAEFLERSEHKFPKSTTFANFWGKKTCPHPSSAQWITVHFFLYLHEKDTSTHTHTLAQPFIKMVFRFPITRFRSQNAERLIHSSDHRSTFRPNQISAVIRTPKETAIKQTTTKDTNFLIDSGAKASRGSHHISILSFRSRDEKGVLNLFASVTSVRIPFYLRVRVCVCVCVEWAFVPDRAGSFWLYPAPIQNVKYVWLALVHGAAAAVCVCLFCDISQASSSRPDHYWLKLENAKEN